VSATARLAVCSQAPGTRVHASGKPFTDPSGERLHDWMDVTSDEFYDEARVAIVLNHQALTNTRNARG